MQEQCTPTPAPATWTELLDRAMTDPGTVSAAYSAFHNYSLGNQLLALFQCAGRGIPTGPIATFNSWKEKGRSVRKGEKAITLCQPRTYAPKPRDGETAEEAEENDDGTRAGSLRTVFTYRRAWFVLAQTDGEPYQMPETPAWNRAQALTTLGFAELPFTLMNGNTQGYTTVKGIAVSPVAANPLKTTFHELAHAILHRGADHNDADDAPRSLLEAEAEGVAMLVCAALNLPGVEDARGYIQHWRKTEPIPEPSARRILATAGKILTAGQVN